MQHFIMAESPEAYNSDELLQLCASLYDQNSIILQQKINKFLQLQTQAEHVCQIIILLEEEELLCQVVGDKILDETLRFPITNNGLHVPLCKTELINEDDIFPHKKELADKLQCTINSFMCIPIFHPENTNKVVILSCLINKQTHSSFTLKDREFVEKCFLYTINILLTSIAFENEQRLRHQCQSLLTVAKNLFTHLDDVAILLREIMAEARHLTKAERCSLFLLDRHQNELVAKVFDGNVTEEELSHEVRIPANEGIAGHVATTGELLNIRDAYSHPLFYSKMDKATGFKTKNILCFPIKDNEGVMGIAELCNKIDDLHFSTFDEEIAMAFSVYCGISIMHSLMWKKVRDAQHRSKLSNELMMYHMQVSKEEMKDLAEVVIPNPIEFHPDICTFSFLPRELEENTTPMVIVSMVADLGMISRWRISRETLARFTIMVRKGYRDTPYHNWMHAFSAAHFCYVLIKNLQLMEEGYLKELECLALFMACLCHDLDHRGTTNSFQVASKSVLAALYSSEGSVMERHHFAQTMCILNTEGCNVFENLSRKDYTKCLDLVRDVILSTDLAQHLRSAQDYRRMIEDGFDKSNQKHHSLLLSLLMTCCDLSDQTKAWHHSKKIAELVYREFFSQGDLEKAMGYHPSEMMDRERACIPELQINFLSHIVIPLYSFLAELFSDTKVALITVEHNRIYWERVRDLYKSRFHINDVDMIQYIPVLSISDFQGNGMLKISRELVEN